MNIAIRLRSPLSVAQKARYTNRGWLEYHYWLHESKNDFDPIIDNLVMYEDLLKVWRKLR